MFTKFPVLCEKLLKVSLRSFGSDVGNTKVDRTLRIQSCLCVRSLGLADEALLDDAYKGLYRTFQSCARFANNKNMKSILFMQDCVVEVYGIMSEEVMYKHVFNFVKEIALLLRNALLVKTKEAYSKMYSLQVICSLDLLESLVSRYGSEPKDVLNPMIYPLVQVVMMTVTLVPSSRYLPLRFHVLKTILAISKNAGVFVPLSSMIMDALNFSELTKKPSGVGTHFNMNGVLKVPKPVLRTISFQDQWVAQTVLLLCEHLSQWSHHIAFPELFHPTGIKLKSFMKSDLLVKKFKAKIAQAVDAAMVTAESILAKRQLAPFSPKDTDRVEMFMKDNRDSGPSAIDKLFDALTRQANKLDEMNSASDVLVGADAGELPEEATRGNPLDGAEEVAEYKKDILVVPKKKKETKGQEKEEKVLHEDMVEDVEMSSESEDSSSED